MKWLPLVVVCAGCFDYEALSRGGTDGGAQIDLMPLVCELGWPDHCGACGVSCPAADAAVSSVRTCSDATTAGACGVTCRGEFYDVDGALENGCEKQDLPIQDSPTTAVALDLPSANPLNHVATLYGDSRMHESAPTSRPLGRDDWYRVTATGTGVAGKPMTACLGIVNFPADNLFEVCISDPGVTTFLPAGCNTVGGGAMSACPTPPSGSDAGVYHVRVRRVQGSQTVNAYALFLQH